MPSIIGHIRTDRRTVLVVVGFACYTAWTESVFACSALLSSNALATTGQETQFRMAYCIIACVLCAMAFIQAPALYRFLMKTRPGKALCAALAVASAPLATLSGWGTTPVFSASIGAALVAATCLIVFTYWVKVLGSLPLPILFLSVSLSFALSSLLPATLPRSQPILFTAGCSLFAVVSWALMLSADRTEPSSAQRPDPYGGHRNPEATARTTRRIVARLAVCLCAWFFALRAARCVLVAGSETVWQGSVGTSNAMTFTLTIALFVCVAALLSFPTKFKFEWTYRFLFLLSVGTVLGCIPHLPRFIDRELVSSLDFASLQLFAMIMWAVEAALSTNGSIHPMRVATFCGAFWSLGSAGGLLFSRAFSDMDAEAATLAAAGLALLLAACYTAVFTEHDVALLTEIIPEIQRRPFKERCLAIGARYGLTERETEIMAYVAKGRDTPYIQEALSLSKNTVNFHRKNLYAKLGIHSKQELLDLIKRDGEG